MRSFRFNMQDHGTPPSPPSKGRITTQRLGFTFVVHLTFLELPSDNHPNLLNTENRRDLQHFSNQIYADYAN